MFPIVSDIPEVQAHYDLCRTRGTSHNLAKILAFGKPPGCNTNRELMRGAATLADHSEGEEYVLDKIARKAERLGRKPQYTDLYCPGLVSPDIGPGDPAAFVPASEGSSHIKRVCEQRGLDCHGLVNVTAPTLDPPPPLKRRRPLPPMTAAESKYPLQPIQG